MAEVADVLEDAAPLRVAKRASGAVSPIPGTASLGQEEPLKTRSCGIGWFADILVEPERSTPSVAESAWAMGTRAPDDTVLSTLSSRKPLTCAAEIHPLIVVRAGYQALNHANSHRLTFLLAKARRIDARDY
jgi:hypothetical protein